MSTEIEYSTAEPLNREPSKKKLVDSFITPQNISYDRNHGPIPYITASTHTVRIDGVPNPVSLSIHQLATEFPQHEVTCALECAGNRRRTMRTLLKEVQGIDWGDCAVMNCTWRGPRLRDVLIRAGVRDDEEDEDGSGEKQVAFGCYQVECQDDSWFGGSIPLQRGLGVEGEVILALEMNNTPLTPNHGYPIRAVLPGVAGARWVKWLDRISIQPTESTNFYQKHDYKILPPDAVDSASAEKYWSTTPAMYNTAINSVIAVPEDDETVRLDTSGRYEIRGYAVPGGIDGPVTKVQVSVNGGESWVDASIGDTGKGKKRGKWCWVLWRARVCIPRGTGREVVSRAFDAGGNVQEEHSQWNLRGVGYNGFGRARNLTIL